MKKYYGFTIVELLVVIVIITVLAAIVISTYNNIQTQADNSKTAAAVSSYKKALLQYAVEKGSYPRVTGSACLGEGYPDNTCFRSSTTVNNIVSFNNNIRLYMGQVAPLPLPSVRVFQSGSTTYWGATMFYNPTTTLDGEPQLWWIVYYMDGNVRCPVGPIVSTAGWPAISSTYPVNGRSTYHASGKFAECWIPMPDPATLG